MLSLLLMLACAPAPAPAPVCALDVTESLTFSAQADACDAEWITLRNTGDVAVYCALSEVLSTCQGNPFVLSEPSVSLSPGDTYGATAMTVEIDTLSPRHSRILSPKTGIVLV